MLDPYASARIHVGLCLNDFVGKNTSTSTVGEQDKSDKIVPLLTSKTGIEIVQELCGPLHDIPPLDYAHICSRITTPIVFEGGEVKHYHPRIAEMLLAICPEDKLGHLYRGKNISELEQQIPKRCYAIPDFCFGTSKFSSDIYLHFEVKKIDNLVKGISQSLGYTCITLIDRIELLRDPTRVYFAHALATDGRFLGVSHVTVSIDEEKENPVMIFTSSGDESLPIDPLVGNNGEQSLGIKALYYMLRKTPEDLGLMAGDNTLDDHILLRVLGKGGFSTVYEAQVTNEEPGLPIVAFKLPHYLPNITGVRIMTSQKKLNLSVLKELEVLKALAEENNFNIPKLSRFQCPNERPIKWLSISQVGEKLDDHLASLTKPERVAFAKNALIRGLRSALLTAHNKGYGHCDVRPENVIVLHHEVILIDWGLSSKLGTVRHKWRGGVMFYDDAILSAKDPNADVIVNCEQDLASANYVAVAAIWFEATSRGCHNYPWKVNQKVNLQQALAIRREEVRLHLSGL